MTMDTAVNRGESTVRQNHRLLALAWGVYLAMAPVAWLPGIPQPAYTAVKTSVFAAAVAATWLYARDRGVPRGLAGPVGLALMAASSIFALAQAASTTAALRSLLEVGLAFGVLWTIYVFERNVMPIWQAAAMAALVHGLVSLLIVAAFAGWFEAMSPLRPDSIVDTGLGGWRTGWSNGVALFVPFGLITVVRPGLVLPRVVFGLATAATLAGQLVTGGRGGVVVTLISVVLMLAFTLGLPGIVIGAVSVVVVAVALVSGVGADIGIDRFDQSLSNDDTTATRIELLRFGVDQVEERPLVGHGSAVPVYTNIVSDPLEIHNVPLRLAAEGGLLLAASLVAVVASILAKAVDVLWRASKGLTTMEVPVAAALLTCLLGGVLVSMIEPNIFLGTMHVSVIWWVSAGAVAASYATVKVRDRTVGLGVVAVRSAPDPRNAEGDEESDDDGDEHVAGRIGR